MIYELHPPAAAEAELTSATLYYAKEANRASRSHSWPNLRVFLSWSNEINSWGTKSKVGLRVYPFRRFPYSIVYRESQAGPYIYAVAHQRREPGYWLSRV